MEKECKRKEVEEEEVEPKLREDVRRTEESNAPEELIRSQR